LPTWKASTAAMMLESELVHEFERCAAKNRNRAAG
jgi:hypothetical protein